MRINNFSNFIEMTFNPYSTSFNSKKYFHSKLNHNERIKVIAKTIFVSFFTLGLGGMATFRYSVSVYAAQKRKSSPATAPLNQFIHSIFDGSFTDYKKIEYYSNDEVKSLLTGLFGKTATNSVFCWYKSIEKKHISSITVHALVIGIVSNLTEKDLDVIEKNLQDPYFIHINNQIFLKISDPVERKVELLRKLRDIPLLPKTPFIKQETERRGFQDQLAKDSEFLSSCRWIDNIAITPDKKTYELKKFSYSEYLSRVIIYGLEAKGNFAAFQPGTLIPVPLYNEVAGKEQIVLMETHRLVSKGGLHAIVLIPSKMNMLHRDQTLPVQIIFRGTQCTSAWNRNLNLLEKQQMYGWEGPGGASFSKSRLAILEELQNILSFLPPHPSIKIEIFGHSLGASDAQRMCVLLTEALKEEEVKPNKEVKEINLFCYNAPGVEDVLNQRFLEIVESLSDIKFQLRYFKVAHDPIQTAANQLLGYCFREEEPIKNLFISVFKIALPVNGFFAAHTTTFLCNYTDITKKTENNAWIEFVKTNNPEDSKIHQRGPTGDEPPSPSKYKHSSAYKALDNRGIWRKSVHSYQTQAWDQLSSSYLALSEKLYGSKDLKETSLVEIPENMEERAPLAAELVLFEGSKDTP